MRGLTTNNGVPFVEFDFGRRFGDVTAGVSLRQGGSSSGDYAEANMSYAVGDDPANVEANRRGFVESLGLDPRRLTMGRQVHDGHVHVVEKSDIGRGGLDPDSAIAGTDGLITDEPDAVLAVLQADCVPVAFYDPNRRVIAVAHAGWPGTVAKVTTNVLRIMIDDFGSDPRDIWAAIGPSIGPESYEVKEDVASQARAAFAPFEDGDSVIINRYDGTMAFDLWRANQLQILAVGIPQDQVQVTGLDSYVLNDRFFSHRRAAPCGRFLCLVALR